MQTMFLVFCVTAHMTQPTGKAGDPQGTTYPLPGSRDSAVDHYTLTAAMQATQRLTWSRRQSRVWGTKAGEQLIDKSLLATEHKTGRSPVLNMFTSAGLHMLPSSSSGQALQSAVYACTWVGNV